ncbi:MAG: hypothetical protein ABR583_00155 [Gaiellaceae bacterium]
MRRVRFSRAIAAVVAAAVVAALAAAASKAPATTPAEREPPFCRGADVRALVDEFVRAFNRGDREELSFIWVRIRYQWYAVSTASETENGNTRVEYSRKGLFAYFAERHRRGERLALTKFRYIGYSAGWGHFEFALRRRARDLNHGRWATYHGLGAAICLRGPAGLGSWSMALGA